MNTSKISHSESSNKPIKTMLSWSSGKDSAYTLRTLQQDPSIELVGLFTSINQEFQRVAMHAVRVALLKEQAKHAGTLDSSNNPMRPMHLEIIELPFPCTNDDYERIMSEFCEKILAMGVEQVAFGDLFLEDVRDYRIRNLKDTGLTPIFPIWGLDTTELAQTMVDTGQKAVITCIDPKKLDKSFCGRQFDQSFLDDIHALNEDNAKQGKPLIDPCGENGEFHSFVYDGAMFHTPIDIEVGEIVERDGFVFADVLPRGN